MVNNEVFQKWKELLRDSKLVESAEEFYDKNIFPEVEQKFISRVQERVSTGEIPKYEYLIISGGLNKAFPIMLIKSLKPKLVYFIGTKEFKSNILSKVVEATKLSVDSYDYDIIDYSAMDVADVYEKLRKRLAQFEGKKVLVDITRGRRVQCVGVGTVAAFYNFDLGYIDKGWDQETLFEPGTEELVIVKNPFDVFGDMENLNAVRLFNNHNYSAAAVMFGKLCKQVIDPREYEVKQFLSSAYDFWDAFNYNAAAKRFEDVLTKIKQYKLAIRTDKLSANLEVLKNLEKLQSSKFAEFLPNSKLIVHLLIDLYLNAIRRNDQNRVEDAIIRLYRVIDLVAQHRLAIRGLDTERPDYSKLNIEKEYLQLSEAAYGRSKRSLPFEIGLKDAHLFLFILKDELWKDKSIDDLKTFFEPIRLRDQSIIAHGAEIVSGKTFQKIEKISKEFIAKICQSAGQDWQQIVEKHQFVKL